MLGTCNIVGSGISSISSMGWEKSYFFGWVTQDCQHISRVSEGLAAVVLHFEGLGFLELTDLARFLFQYVLLFAHVLLYKVCIVLLDHLYTVHFQYSLALTQV